MAITEVTPDITVDPSPVIFPPTVISPAMVVTPAILTLLPNSKCPAISAAPSTSNVEPTFKVFEKVAKPVITRSSKLVNPSTSNCPFASMLPVNVEMPDTFKESVFIIPVSTPTFSNPEPSPKNDVAVTELIPDIFVALSPIIFPFATKLPAMVVTPVTSRLLNVDTPIGLIPLSSRTLDFATPTNSEPSPR